MKDQTMETPLHLEPDASEKCNVSEMTGPESSDVFVPILNQKPAAKL
jgi:hypothetical protein